MKTTQQIDQRLVKKTFFRFLKYGNIEEIFVYEKPIFYNHSPFRALSGTRTKKNQRRNDNLYVARLRINHLVIANTNFAFCSPRFVTFTFTKNVTSLKEANLEWGKFMRKFRSEFGSRKYLGVVEFQKRGAVHYHVLFFDLKYRVGIKDTIAFMWGNGFVKFKSAKKIGGIEHLGLYIAKYLQKEIIDLRLIGEKAFFTSQNLTQPIILRKNDTCERLYFKILKKGATVETYQSANFGIINKHTLKYESENTRGSNIDQVEDSEIY